jgi:hypothetical protein
MKQSTMNALKSVIKKMIKEEVKNQLNQIENEQHEEPADDADWYQGPDEHHEVVKYADDPVLNKILNETKGGIQGDTGMEPYPTMTGGVTDTQEKFFQQTGKAPIGNIGSQADMPNFMKKAMSGHYKEVIDKVEETRGTRTK